MPIPNQKRFSLSGKELFLNGREKIVTAFEQSDEVCLVFEREKNKPSEALIYVIGSVIEVNGQKLRIEKIDSPTDPTKVVPFAEGFTIHFSKLD